MHLDDIIESVEELKRLQRAHLQRLIPCVPPNISARTAIAISSNSLAPIAKPIGQLTPSRTSG